MKGKKTTGAIFYAEMACAAIEVIQKAQGYDPRSDIDMIAGIMMDESLKSPEDAHNKWLDYKSKNGWVYGEKISQEEKKHPCMVEYSELLNIEKLKDHIIFFFNRRHLEAKKHLESVRCR